MSKYSSFLLFFVLTVSSLTVRSQVNDMGLWLSAGLEKKLSQHFSFTMAEEVRLNENISEAGTIFSDLGLGYKINKNMKFSANYRFISRRQPDDSYLSKHRYYFDFAYRVKARPLIFQLRERFQLQDDSPNILASGSNSDHYLRSRFTVRYNSGRKTEPFLFAESYHRFSNNHGTLFRKMRYSAGIDYEVNNQHSLTLFYLIQYEVNVNNPETDYVIGLGYNFSF